MMTAQANFADGIPAEQLTAEVRAALARLADENALLRAALAEARAQVGDLEEASDRDPLTGLAGARELAREIDRVAGRAARHGTPAALLAIDIKGLGAINDAHGRVAGDAALAHVARLLQGLIRASDVAARSGGGFGLLLDHLDPDSAVDTGERIARFIAGRPLDLGGAEVAIEATIGIATILPGDCADDVLRRAERNLARVKELG